MKKSCIYGIIFIMIIFAALPVCATSDVSETTTPSSQEGYSDWRDDPEYYGENILTVFDPVGIYDFSELVDLWNETSWPDFIGFAYYGELIGDMQVWTIGMVEDTEDNRKYLASLVSNPCSFKFVESKFRYNDLLELYPVIFEKYGNDLACSNIFMVNTNYICVVVSDFVYFIYEHEFKQYGGMVMPILKSQVGISDIDKYGAGFWSYNAFELIVMGGVIILISAIIIVVIILIVIHRKKIKAHKVNVYKDEKTN
jgi:hypothetical protein